MSGARIDADWEGERFRERPVCGRDPRFGGCRMRVYATPRGQFGGNQAAPGGVVADTADRSLIWMRHRGERCDATPRCGGNYLWRQAPSLSWLGDSFKRPFPTRRCALQLLG
jgi:hypothetical protein